MAATSVPAARQIAATAAVAGRVTSDKNLVNAEAGINLEQANAEIPPKRDTTSAQPSDSTASDALSRATLTDATINAMDLPAPRLQRKPIHERNGLAENADFSRAVTADIGGGGSLSTAGPGTSPQPPSQVIPQANLQHAVEHAEVMGGQIRAAHLGERVGQSEMRVGLASSDFGNIELHATLAKDHIAATIATGHTELRAALLSEIPHLKQAMSQHRLTLDGLQLDARSNSDNGQQSLQHNRSQSTHLPAAPGDTLPSSAEPEESTSFNWSDNSLNVHA
jgi:flagellar hook-length control protein FliK